MSRMVRAVGAPGRAPAGRGAIWVRLLPASVACAAVLAVAGCGSNASTTAGGSNSSSGAAKHKAAVGTVAVVMRNIAFNPGTVHARVGETVTWTNRDDAPHNVTYNSGPKFTSSPTFTNGKSWSLKLTKPGIIHYMCTIHPGMDGTIIVSASVARPVGGRRQ